MATPYVLVELASAGSTQDEARSRFEGRPTLVTARRQRSGRGRSGREWVHAPRALAASLAFRPGWPTGRWGPLPLVAGLAARDVLGGAVALKWPNDLLLGEAKIGGILAEGAAGVAVVGLGVNLWWEDPIPGAGALYGEDPGPEAAGPLAGGWAARLLDRAAAGPDGWGREEYAAGCETLGREITWEPGGRGVATGVAADGALIVDGGRVELRAGEVRSVR